MGTLASELGPHADRLSESPRVYVDANVPAGLVSFMRSFLRWDVLFVMEHDELRRARDGEHFRLARQLRRTLITLDRDYLDARRFPPDESAGVLVLTAPSLGGYRTILKRLDVEVWRASPSPELPDPKGPFVGKTLHLHVNWESPVGPVPNRSR